MKIANVCLESYQSAGFLLPTYVPRLVVAMLGTQVALAIVGLASLHHCTHRIIPPSSDL